MNMKVQQILEYSVFFEEDARDISIDEIISQLPRELLFKYACVINNIYANSTIDKLDIFFSASNEYYRSIVNKKATQLKAKNPLIEYIICSDLTGLEILRYAFSLQYEKRELSSNEDNTEMLLFKLLLKINEKIVKFSIEEKDNNLGNISFLLSVITPTIKSDNKNDIINRVCYQTEMAIKFFELISVSENYKPLYDMFLKKYGIKSWKCYIQTILGLLCYNEYKSGLIDKNLNFDIDNIFSKTIIEEISLPYNSIIRYSAANENDRESNSDYRIFRDKPIIKLEDGNFFIYNIELLIDKIFNSLYFEFNSYPQDEASKIDVKNLFTEIFSEKVIFDHYMNKCIDKYTQCGYSEEESKKKYNNHKDKELGPSDYIIIDKSSLMLFECKDIRINGEIIETHNYKKIIKEFYNKLNYKPINKGDKRIGVTQLTGNIKNIREGSYNYLDNIDKDITIYPVLVLSDYKNIRYGLNKIINDWYNSSVSKLGIGHSQNKPIIILSFITLFKYNKLFKQDGFKYYFDDYIERLMGNKILTFDDYMSKNYKCDISECRDNIMETISYKESECRN